MNTTAPLPDTPVAAGSVTTAPVPAVTAVFVRLKLSLLLNGLRQSPGRKSVYVISMILVALFATLQLLGLIALRGNAHAAAVTTLLATLFALGWAVMPLFFSGGDETLDPTRLVMLPLRPTSLVAALLVASLIGIGPVFTLAMIVGSVVATAHGAAAAAVAVLATVLILLVCVALARAVATANVRLLTSRKGRDLAVLSGLIIGVGMQFVNVGMQKLSGAGGLSSLEPVAQVLRWVPPGSAMDAVRAASDGSYGAAAGELALTAALLAVLLWWWQRSLTRLMTSPDSSTLQAATDSGSTRGDATGQARLVPGGRTGAVMLRSWRYIRRDPKTKAALISSLAIGLLMPVINAVQGRGSIYYAFFAAGLLGIQMYNQFGQDTSAFWMVLQTIASPRDAFAELRGRTLALSVIAVPYVTAAVVFTAAFTGDWQALPEVLGLSYALLGAMFGTGAVTSVTFPYTIPQENGFKNVAPGQVGIAWLSLFGGLIVGGMLCSPLIALAVWLHLSGTHALLWLLTPLGAVYGAGIAYLGLRVAAPRVAARLPEILLAVSKG
ncbi:transporter [Streptantibioticus ferralitis]|uniref:Transporter n=1 Tax=Streptantibioticus ferralitis TaxID=236510 RepID=A0ABT5YUA2_9ACTN|nr:transporter [Streptantibioticus ferralitis]MDF2255191.1 transporter [Streptantibioticus ferralitis]